MCLPFVLAFPSVAGCAGVPGRDRAGTMARSVHDRHQLLQPRGHVHGGHGELRRQHHPEVGLAPLARRWHRSSYSHYRRRGAHPGHAQQSGAPREARRGPCLAAAHPRGGGRHRRGAQGHRARRGAGAEARVRSAPAPVSPSRVPPSPARRSSSTASGSRARRPSWAPSSPTS